MKQWNKLVAAQMKKFRADPTRLFNAHFYEARLAGRLRIFDLYRDPSGKISIAESLVGRMKPLMPLSCPPTVSALYTHVNYGAVNSQSPDEVMKEFAVRNGLTGMLKLCEIKNVIELADTMDQALSRLSSEYCTAS